MGQREIQDFVWIVCNTRNTAVPAAAALVFIPCVSNSPAQLKSSLTNSVSY